MVYLLGERNGAYRLLYVVVSTLSYSHFAQGLGFSDIVRRPTPTAAELSRAEKAAAVPGLVKRLRPYRKAEPLILFEFRLLRPPRRPAAQWQD